MSVADLVAGLRESRGFQHKTDIAGVVSSLARRLPGGANDLGQAVALGDDCAALADGDGYLLFAIEGMVSDFVQAMPWFAGYSSVMVNVSDIYAMGGRPLAVVDALWSDGIEAAHEVLAGMAAASVAYGVPIVGGHTNARSDQAQLAVSIVGRAKALLSSFNARPGDRLLMAVDLRGRFEEPYPFWNASVGAPAVRLRGDLELLPLLAESGLCDAAKDISMAGTLGTALMLLECSQVGARIDLDAIPKPADVPLARWVTAFPSYGYLLAVREEHVGRVQAQFAARSLACAAIGTVDARREVIVHRGEDAAVLWDFSGEPFIGAAAGAAMNPRTLRIALLTHSVNPRGGVVHTLELANALSAQGHHVTVFAPATNGETLFRLPSCRVVYAPVTGSQVGTVALVDARIRALKSSLRMHGTAAFDILHAEDSISGNALAELKEEGAIRGFVRTVHHLDHFDSTRLAAWQERGYRDADRVLCVSDTWTREMQQRYGIEAVTVPNGVETTRFTSEPLPEDELIRQRLGIGAGPLVLAVGGIEERKNTLALLDAFPAVLSVCPGAQLVVAGGASLLDHDAYTRRFIQRAAQHGLSIGPHENVVITGPLEDAALPALFRSADVLAMVSVREGFGLVVLEALACGTPVVVSAIAPFTEYLDDATCCWADPTDADSIAAALLRVIRGDSGTDFAQAVPALLARYSWAASAGCHVDAYRAWLAQPLAVH